MEIVKLPRNLRRPCLQAARAATVPACRPGQLIVLRAAALFDGVGPALMDRPSVVMADGRIAAVHGPAGPVPTGARVVDLPGLTLLPGLVDAHLHLCFDATSDPVGHLAETGDDLLRERMAEAARRALRDAGVSPAKPHDVLRFAPGDMAVAGLSPAEILQAMTSQAAQACGLGHRKGRIAAGFDADILAIDGNPLEDLTAIRRLRAVYAGGRPVLPPSGSPAGSEEL